MNIEEVFIESVAYSKNISEACLLILTNEKGDKKIPITIGSFEASAIILGIKEKAFSRPMTYDLFKNCIESFDFKLQKVLIYKVFEGIFYSHLSFMKNGKEKIIDSRPSDAIALATRFNVPIFINIEVLKEVAYNPLENDKNDKKNNKKSDISDIENISSDVSFIKNLKEFSPQKLKTLLKKLEANEEYEKAIIVRDEIRKRKNDT